MGLIFANPLRVAAVAIALLLFLALGVQSARLLTLQAEYAQLQTSVAQERQARATQRAADEAIARAKENEIRDRADAQRKADEDALLSLGADRDRLAGLLRNRPSRPAAGSAVAPVAAAAGSSSSAGEPAVAGTGAGLYAEDGAFLAGEAARAKHLAIAAESCVRQYNAARDALKKGQQP